MTFVWSEEAVERLKALHAQGLSGSELASRLGRGLTRSAIFGKLHRLRLTGKTGAPKRRAPHPITCYQATGGFGDRAARGGAVHGAGPMKFNFARRTPRSEARGGGVPHSEDRILPPPSLRIGIVDIGDGQCRFIFKSTGELRSSWHYTKGEDHATGLDQPKAPDIVDPLGRGRICGKLPIIAAAFLGGLEAADQDEF